MGRFYLKGVPQGKGISMSGLYIHIPYCMKACSYCNFHFSTSTNTVDDMVNSILMELELRKNQCFEKIETIYFGGGTPSLITPEYLDKIMILIKNEIKVK